MNMQDENENIIIKYNFLTPIKKTKKDEISRTWFWLFKCDCGKEKEIKMTLVKNNRTKSCGCLKLKNLNNKKSVDSNKWKGKTPIPITYINSVKNRAIKKNIEYKIDENFLYELFKKQNGLCMLSGLKLQLQVKKPTASIDRIDSNQGYIENNVQWVHKDINYLKYNLNQNDFINICKTIVNNYEKNNK